MELSNTSIDNHGYLSGIGPGTFLKLKKNPNIILMITRPLDERGERYEARMVKGGGGDGVAMEDGEEQTLDKAAIDRMFDVIKLDPETAEQWRQMADLKPLDAAHKQAFVKMANDYQLNEELNVIKTWTSKLLN